MKEKALLAITFALLLMMSTPVPAAAGQAEAELPLHTQRLSDRILLAWVGNHMQTIRVVAFSTARGIVVIEANRILVVRGTSIHENNVEAIWEKLAARYSSGDGRFDLEIARKGVDP